MSKLLVIGASGLTGYKLVELAQDEFTTFGTYNIRPVNMEGCEFFQLDKTDRFATSSLIHKLKPEIVVDCAAMHNVNYCESHKDEAYRVNVEGTRNVAEACKDVGARMVFVSTDYVFDGTKGFYSEEDEPNPLNCYGLTKLEAEEKVAKMGIDYAIARTSVIYGWNPGEVLGKRSSSGKSMNFVIWVLSKLRNEERIKIVMDQYSSPTLADNLAKAILILAKSEIKGIFHTVGKGCVNRFEFALKIANVFELNKDLIQPVTSDVFKQVAKRPMKCCLNVVKAEKELGIKFLTISEGLMKMEKIRVHANSLYNSFV